MIHTIQLGVATEAALDFWAGRLRDRGGVEGAYAYAGAALDADAQLLTETLGFTAAGEGEYRVEGDERHFHWGYDSAPGAGVQGSGTVHHIAWHSRDEEHVPWQQRAGTGRSRERLIRQPRQVGEAQSGGDPRTAAWYRR